MRRVKTVADRDISVNSQTKRRLTREDLKRIKMEKLKLKFKNAYRQVQQLKQQNVSDFQKLNQMKINSQKMTRLAVASMQKAKRIFTESSVGKRYSLPPAIECSHFQEAGKIDASNIQKKDENIVLITDKKDVDKRKEYKEQQFETIKTRIDFEVSVKQQTQQTAHQQGNRETYESTLPNSIVVAKQSQIKYDEQSIQSQISKRLKQDLMQQTSRQNRFQLEVKRSSVKKPSKSKKHKKLEQSATTKMQKSLTLKKNVKAQSMLPYICSIIFSIFMLYAISH